MQFVSVPQEFNESIVPFRAFYNGVPTFGCKVFNALPDYRNKNIELAMIQVWVVLWALSGSNNMTYLSYRYGSTITSLVVNIYTFLNS